MWVLLIAFATFIIWFTSRVCSLFSFFGPLLLLLTYGLVILRMGHLILFGSGWFRSRISCWLLLLRSLLIILLRKIWLFINFISLRDLFWRCWLLIWLSILLGSHFSHFLFHFIFIFCKSWHFLKLLLLALFSCTLCEFLMWQFRLISKFFLCY